MPPMTRKKAGASKGQGGNPLKDLAAGSALGALSLTGSFLVGLRFLGKMYFVEWVTVVVMGFYLLVAWLVYLRDDAFMKRRDSAIVETSGKRTRRVLLAASAFLAFASLALYFIFGVGATP